MVQIHQDMMLKNPWHIQIMMDDMMNPLMDTMMDILNKDSK